jgi:hypothetical protein
MHNTRTTSNMVHLYLLLTLVFAAGCGGYDKWKDGRPKTYFTSGKVLLDGEPVEGATVTFQPVDEALGKPGTAVTDSNGYFEVQTFDPGDGLTEGVHRVAIAKTRMLDKATKQVVTEVNSDAPLIEDHLLPKKFSSFTTSKLEVTIQAGTNKMEAFDLPSK